MGSHETQATLDLILRFDLEGLEALTGLPAPQVNLTRKQRRDLALFFLHSLQVAHLRDRTRL